MDFDNHDLRQLIYFLWKEGRTPPDIMKKINSALGDETISARTCQRWVAKFQAGDFDVSDSQRGGRPSLDVDD